MKREHLVIVIPSKGRPSILFETLQSIAKQVFRAEKIVLSVTDPKTDLPSVLPETDIPVQVIKSEIGLTKQRNAAIRAIAHSCSYVAFFDDDVEVHPTYLTNAVSFLQSEPRAVAISGNLLADGGITREQARDIVAGTSFHATAPTFRHTGKYHELYGCNMVIRYDHLKNNLFDENLPLYAYNEDYEISMRLLRLGLVGRVSNCVAVHLRATSSRISAKKFGYSLVANNWYFMKIGSCHRRFPTNYIRFVLVIVIKPLLTSLAAVLRGKLEKDPIGQIKGSLLAVLDILRNRSAPSRILDL